MIAFSLAFGVDLQELKDFSQGMIMYAHLNKLFGPTGRMTKIVESGIRKFLKSSIYDDVLVEKNPATRLNGRLFVSITLMNGMYGSVLGQ